MNEHFVIVKLVSGEQVMATLTNEDETSVELHYPMVIWFQYRKIKLSFLGLQKAH